LYPVIEVSLSIHDNDTECTIAVTPVPVRPIVAGELVALLLTITDPLAVPLVDGVNVTLTAVLCPGLRIKPPAAPPALKPAPDTITWEIVTLEFPGLLNVTFCEPLLDTFTLPKFKFETLGLRRMVAAGATDRVAAALVALPAPLLTTTENAAPLSAVLVVGVM
jgi:hypothetical protein